MNLDETQKKKIAEWIEAGLKLSEIQKRLETEFGLRATYLEVRLLMDDLKLVPKTPAPTKQEKEIVSPASASIAGPAAAPGKPMPAAVGVTVTVDQIARPGALVSGGVTFTDGQSATWYLDEMGRLALQPKQAGYKPTAPDVQAFQRALQAEMQKLGYG